MEDFSIALFVKALGLALALEGVCWAAMPRVMRRAAESLGRLGDGGLRLAGLGLLAAGVLICRFAG